MSRLAKINVVALVILAAFILGCQRGTPSGKTDPTTGKGINIACGTDFVDFNGDEMYLGAAPRFYNTKGRMALAAFARSECDRPPYSHDVKITFQWCRSGKCGPNSKDWQAISSTPPGYCKAIPIPKEPATCKWGWPGCKVGTWRAKAEVNGEIIYNDQGDLKRWAPFVTYSAILRITSCVPNPN